MTDKKERFDFDPIVPDVEIKAMIGQTFNEINATEDKEQLVFKGDRGAFVFYHYQDCCESVSIEDIVGDFQDLIGSPILKAEERTSDVNPDDADKETIGWQESFTWTFYEFATIKGSVTVRWYGESNGYYSESVDLSYVGGVKNV